MKFSKVLGSVVGLLLVAGITAGCGSPGEVVEETVTPNGSATTSPVKEVNTEDVVVVEGDAEQNEVALAADKFWSVYYGADSRAAAEAIVAKVADKRGFDDSISDSNELTMEEAEQFEAMMPWADWMFYSDALVDEYGLGDLVFYQAATYPETDMSRRVVDASMITFEGEDDSIARIPLGAVSTVINQKEYIPTGDTADILVLVKTLEGWKVHFELTNKVENG